MRVMASFAAVATVAAAVAGTPQAAEAQAYLAAPPSTFVFHGRSYCFAPNGWHGGGWYLCGFAHSAGFGYGGPAGWLGRPAPFHRHPPAWGGGPRFAGGYGGFHRAGWQGGGYGWHHRYGWHQGYRPHPGYGMFHPHPRFGRPFHPGFGGFHPGFRHPHGGFHRMGFHPHPGGFRHFGGHRHGHPFRHHR